MSDNLLINTSKGICTLTLNRPEKHNAFDDALIKALIVALNNINQDKKIRIVVITGKGQSFSSGADLNWMQSMAGYNMQDNINDALQLAELMQTLYTLNKPTIAKINGSAFGGALGLIACCDFAISTANAMFGFSEVKLGLVPAVISPYIINAIGLRHANQLFLTAETFDSFDALEYGLLDEAIDYQHLDETIQSYIDQLLLGGPEAQAACKTLTRKLNPISKDIEQYTTELIAKLRTSKEGQEGLKAFLEKRKPTWN